MAIGYVYLMTNGRDYKIGLTASEPENRRRQLQTGNSEQIDLVAYTICKDMNNLEIKLHRHFITNRKVGEWFSLSEDDLHVVYDLFKKESINLDMSLIPEFVQLDAETDIERLMEIDGKRLAVGKSILHQEKYKHISNYKKIVLEYMREEENFIKDEDKKRQEKRQKEWDEEERLKKLMEEDAERIVLGKKPLHTFEYQVLDDWKNDLEWMIDRIEEKKLRKATKAITLRQTTEGNIIEVIDASEFGDIDFYCKHLECTSFDRVTAMHTRGFDILFNIDLNAEVVSKTRIDPNEVFNGNLIFIKDGFSVLEEYGNEDDEIGFDEIEDIDKMTHIIDILKNGKFQKNNQTNTKLKKTVEKSNVIAAIEERNEEIKHNKIEYEAKQIERKKTGKVTGTNWKKYINEATEIVESRVISNNKKQNIFGEIKAFLE